jgi:hypothetical protein
VHAEIRSDKIRRRFAVAYGGSWSNFETNYITNCFLFSLSPTLVMAQSVQLTIPSSGKKISVPTGLFINNEFVPSVDSQELIESVDSSIR